MKFTKKDIGHKAITSKDSDYKELMSMYKDNGGSFDTFNKDLADSEGVVVVYNKIDDEFEVLHKDDPTLNEAKTVIQSKLADGQLHDLTNFTTELKVNGKAKDALKNHSSYGYIFKDPKNLNGVFTFQELAGGALRVKAPNGDDVILDGSRFDISESANEAANLKSLTIVSEFGEPVPLEVLLDCADLAINERDFIEKVIYGVTENIDKQEYKKAYPDSYKNLEVWWDNFENDVIVPIKESKEDDAIIKYIGEFPDNAKGWNEATDELRDLARDCRIAINQQNNVEEEDEGAYVALDFKKLKTPAQWNTEAKKYIKQALTVMSDKAKREVYAKYKSYFNKNESLNEAFVGDKVKTSSGKEGYVTSKTSDGLIVLTADGKTEEVKDSAVSITEATNYEKLPPRMPMFEDFRKARARKINEANGITPEDEAWVGKKVKVLGRPGGGELGPLKNKLEDVLETKSVNEASKLSYDNDSDIAKFKAKMTEYADDVHPGYNKQAYEIAVNYFIDVMKSKDKNEYIAAYSDIARALGEKDGLQAYGMATVKAVIKAI